MQWQHNTGMTGSRHSGTILITIHVYFQKFDSIDQLTNYSKPRFSGKLINGHA